MKTREFKRLAFGAALIVTTMTMNPASADGTRPLEIRFAGGFLQNVLQLQVDEMGTPTGMLESRSMAFVKGVGTFGRVDIMAVAASGPPETSDLCSDGLIKVADILENNLVLTFEDLSILYGNGTGVVCFNPLDPTAIPTAEIEGTWDGGTGRFAGADGNWSIRFNAAEPVGVATQFVAETGVIKGHLTRPRDDD